LNALGLEGASSDLPQQPAQGKQKSFCLGDGAWDPKTGGGIAVKTLFSLDDDTASLKELVTHYLCVQPSGYCLPSRLFEIKTAKHEGGLYVSGLSVLGRPIDLSQTDLVRRCFGALQSLHADLRRLEFPDVAKVIETFGIPALIGEKLLIPGLSTRGGFKFQPDLQQTGASKEPLSLPALFLPELLGIGSQDLNALFRLENNREKIGYDRQTGAAFNFVAEAELAEKKGSLAAVILPLEQTEENTATKVTQLGWRLEKDSAVFDRFTFMDEPSLRLSPAERQKRIGIVAASLQNLRMRFYPQMLDHIARFKQHDLIDRMRFAPQIDDAQKMVAKIYGGHNDREYLPGFGGTIGGNCRGLFSCWRDENDEPRKKGVLFDLGIVFSKQKGIAAGAHGNWDYVLPDIQDDLKYIDDIFITHLHADHMQGVIDYALRGFLKGKTVHAGAYDIRVLESFLKKAKIPEALWPELDPLKGEGFVHVNGTDRRAMSVYYSVNATSHSTDATDFITVPPPYACDKDGKPLGGKLRPNPHFWAQANLGDMSFPSYNLPDYKGPKPPSPDFKESFFQDYFAALKRDYEAMPESLEKETRRIDEVLCDLTSIHRGGFAPNVLDVEKSFDRLQRWFPDLGFFVRLLSTARRQQRALMRFATRFGRNISAGGAYLENRFTDMNVKGVHASLPESNEKGGNNNAYLKWYADLIGVSPVEYIGRTSKRWRKLLEDNVSKILWFGTGTQGTEIEQDSWGTQDAENRSLMQRDPKHRPTAYGLDLRKFLTIDAQGAIPGNEESQLAQDKQTAFALDRMVATSVHRGARFFNIKGPYLPRIVADLEASGEKYTREDSGGLYIHNFPLYPPGHGWAEDYRQGFLPWFKRNNVRGVAAQHFAKQESYRILQEMAAEQGLKCAPIASNHALYTYEDNGRAFKPLGTATPSFVLARENREWGEYHGGTREYLCVSFVSTDTDLTSRGLMQEKSGPFFSLFGMKDYEKTLREAAASVTRDKRTPDEAQMARPPGLNERRYKPLAGVKAPACFGRKPPHLEAA